MMILAILGGAILGGGTGFVISRNLSRFAGGCPIMCNPKVAVPYFAFMGILLAVEVLT